MNRLLFNSLLVLFSAIFLTGYSDAKELDTPVINNNSEAASTQANINTEKLSIDERLTVLNSLESAISWSLTSLQEAIATNKTLIDESLTYKSVINMEKEIFFHNTITSKNTFAMSKKEDIPGTSPFKENPQIYEKDLIEQQTTYLALSKDLTDIYRYFSLNKNKFFDHALFISKKMNVFTIYRETNSLNVNEISEFLIVTSKEILGEIERVSQKDEILEAINPTGNTMIERIPDGGLLDNWLTAIKTESQADFLVSGYKRVDFSYSKADTGTNTIKRQEELSLKLSGTALNTTINADIRQSSRGTKDENKTQFEIINPNFKAKLGEFQTLFANHTLMQYRDTLDGIEGEVKIGNTTLGVIVSEPKGQLKKQQFQGNNSQGPFILVSRPVIPGSETIELNGKAQVKGIDYEIDYTSGDIRFLTTVVETEDKIVTVYQTDNILFKDQVWGTKLETNTDDITAGLYYLQKKEQTDVFLTNHQGTGVLSWMIGSLKLHQEMSWTKNKSDETTASGSAYFLSQDLKTDLFTWQSEIFKASSTFVPVSGKTAGAGDYRYSAFTTLGKNKHSVSFNFKKSRQNYSDTQYDTRLIDSIGKTGLGPFVVSLTGGQELYTERPNSAALSQNYERLTAEAGLSFSLLGGNISEKIKGERKTDYISSSNGFREIQSQTHWDFSLIDKWNNVVELKVQDRKTGSEQSIEKSLRLTSSLSMDSKNYLRGVTQFRTKTGVPNSVLADISAAWKPFSVWSNESKLTLENLKETFNSQETSVAKWNGSYKTVLKPFKNLESRYTFKTQFKDVDSSGNYPNWNQESLWDTRLSMFGSSLSYQRREKQERRHSFDLYPVITPESSSLSKTQIVRLQTRLFQLLSLSVQSELEDALSSTETDSQHLLNYRLKSELTLKMQRHLLGLTLNIDDKTVVLGNDTDLMRQEIGVFYQMNVSPSTLRFSLAFSKVEDSSFYITYQPAIIYTFRPSRNLDVSVKVSNEHDTRYENNSDLTSWDISAKTELLKMVMTLSVIQQQHIGSENKLDAFLKWNYVF